MNQTKMTQNQIIIDGKNSIMGRLSTFVAKKLVENNKVVIVNTDKVVIIGNPKNTIEWYLGRTRLGHGALKGPLVSRTVVQIMKRSVRGMINWRAKKGKKAFKLLRCYEGIPQEYQKAEILKPGKLPKTKYITLKELSNALKGRK